MNILSQICTLAIGVAAITLGTFAITSSDLEAKNVPSASKVQRTIDARRGYKQFVLHNSSILFEMAKGERAYDAALAADLAGNLKGLTRLKTRSLWAEGTDSDTNPGKTRALMVNWDSAEILDHHAAFRMASGDLAEVAGDGLDSLRTGIVALETACRVCHETYRARDF